MYAPSGLIPGGLVGARLPLSPPPTTGVSGISRTAAPTFDLTNPKTPFASSLYLTTDWIGNDWTRPDLTRPDLT